MNKLLDNTKWLQRSLVCAVFLACAANANAKIDINCTLAAQGIVSATDGFAKPMVSSHSDNAWRAFAPGNCNQSFLLDAVAEAGGSKALIYMQLSQSVTPFQNGYRIDAKGKYFSAGNSISPFSVEGPRDYTPGATGFGTIANAISITSDAPMRYQFEARSDRGTVDSAGWEGIGLVATDRPVGYIGDDGPRDIRDGNRFSISGVADGLIGPGQVDDIRSAQSAIYAFTSAGSGFYLGGLTYGVGTEYDPNLSALQPGADWEFSLAVTPVPEPSTYMMFLAGVMGLGFFMRKRSVK